nr:MAG TPA: AAA domain protein [Caudoviricetes sp.]
MSSRSCFNCQNCVQQTDAVQQSKLYGKPTGMTTCSARGIVIAGPNMSAFESLQRSEELGDKCPKFGKSTPNGSHAIALSIGAGTPTIPEGQHRPARNCRACYFYIAAAAVTEKIGLPMGACARFGKLIPDLKAAQIAQNCGASIRGDEVTDPSEHRKMLLDSLVVDPELARYVVPGATKSNVTLKDAIDNSIEPSTYPTDKPVTPAQDAAGIRAWRRLTQGKREVYLPIFKREMFDEVEQAKIPATNSQEHPETYVDHQGLAYTVATLWFHLDETPALHGKAGTGKTELFRYMAWLMQIPFERISITGESEKDDLAGKFHLEDNETVFKDGRIVAAWKKPNVVVLDEPNTGPDEVWQFVRPLTDNSKQLINDANEGETVERNRFCFLGMAMNPAWDHRNTGARVIGDADGSRLMHIFVDMPPEGIERQVIKARCTIDGYDIEDIVLDSVMEIAKVIREMSDNGELPITWGVRNQIKVARATAWFPFERAYRLAVLDYLEPDTRAMVTEVVAQQVKKVGGAIN